MSGVPVSVGKYRFISLSSNSRGSPDSLPLIIIRGQSMRLHICLNVSSSLSLSKAVSIGSTLPSMSCARLLYFLSSFSPFCPLHTRWKSMRFFASVFVVPVLVGLKLGSHRGESGEELVLTIPTL